MELTAEALKLIYEKHFPPATVSVGGREFRLDPGKLSYDEVEPRSVESGKVSNVADFAALVVEEARRRENSDGEWMTVTFHRDGATFHPDARQHVKWRDAYTYSRRTSQQLAHVFEGISKPQGMSHKEFLFWLNGLRPSLGENYLSVSRAYRVVKFEKGTEFSSRPILVDGQAGKALSIEYRLKGESFSEKLPAEVVLNLQVSRGGSRVYQLLLAIDAFLTDGPDEKQEIRFAVSAPDVAHLQETEIDAERREFAEDVAVNELHRLLIVESY